MTGGIFANQSPGKEINFWLDWLSTDFDISLSDRQLERFLALYERLNNYSHLWLNRGWPPIELHLETMSASPPISPSGGIDKPAAGVYNIRIF